MEGGWINILLTNPNTGSGWINRLEVGLNRGQYWKWMDKIDAVRFKLLAALWMDGTRRWKVDG